ncbi:MAG: hypothetical protein V4463_07950 [Pseudomonadota bacterium]
MKRLRLTGQAGLALPIMLIMLVIMLVSSVYLLKSSTSTALATGNMAYEAALSKSADLGLLTAFGWLDTTARNNKLLLNADSAGDGYVSTMNTTQTVHTPAFWNGSKTIVDAAGNHIEYVIHRMCRYSGAYDLIGPPPNNCMQTAANTSTLNNTVALGDSLASDASQLAGVPQVHYVVTSRIAGPRGGNVINQAVVMIGA